MDEQGGGKISGIRQIVKLKEIIHKWQNIAISSRSNNNVPNSEQYEPVGISPSVTKRIKETVNAGDSDEEGCQSPEPPPDVPKGFLAVYVGEEVPRRRFVIPTMYLTHNLFKVLLEKAEEEFGFDHGGGLTLPCEVETFKYLINCIETENQGKEEHSKATGGESSQSKD